MAVSFMICQSHPDICSLTAHLISTTPSVPNYSSLWLFLSPISLTLTKFVQKMHQYFIKFSMKYVLMVHLFELADVNRFF
jgi:hypothetical protein